MARQNKVFIIHDLPDKRFIQGKVMVPDSVTEQDVFAFINDLEIRMLDLLAEEENV